MTPQTAIRRAESISDLVRADASTSDANRRLTHSVALSMAELNLYRIAAPPSFGGIDADTKTQMLVIETVSTAGGAAGWNLMIGMEIFGLVAPSMKDCQVLVADPLTIMAGSTASVGTAEQDGSDFVVAGQWQFVSGIHNADVFGATVRLTSNAEPIEDTLYYAMIPRGDYEIIDTWNVGGLRGSGSHDVAVNNARVPANRIVATLGRGELPSRQLKIPLGVRLTFNKVAVALGIARAGMNEFRDLASGKIPRFARRKLHDRPIAQLAIAKAEARLRGVRAAIYEQAERVWEICQSDDELEIEDRALTHVLACDSVQACIEAVTFVAEASGTTANDRGHPLERIVRDVRVVQQHATVSPHHMYDAGRALLGLEPSGILLM